MRLGVFGGTFDPIHLGHLIIAQEILDRGVVDRVLFVPAGNPWMKSAAFPLPTGGTLIHRPPTGPQIHPQPVDNGDSRTDSGGIAWPAGVNLLANRGTAHKPRCQRTSICIILFES